MIKMPVLMKMYVKIRFVWSRDEDDKIRYLEPVRKHFIRTLILLLLKIVKLILAIRMMIARLMPN